MNNKKGISLIVLVITILVMIILAGVVIVSLQNDNPINKAKYAKMVDSVQSVRAAISQYAVAAQANETESLTYDAQIKALLNMDPDGTKGVLKPGTGEGLNSKTVKDILGVDPTTVQAYGDFIVYVETGRSEFEVNETGAALKGDNTYPDGIVDNK